MAQDDRFTDAQVMVQLLDIPGQQIVIVFGRFWTQPVIPGVDGVDLKIDTN